MSDIKILDYAKSVESSKMFLQNTIKNKGIDVKENSSLFNLIAKVTELPALEKEAIYELPLEFKQLMNEYENDTLLQRNGGEYVSCLFSAYTDKYDKFYCNFGSYYANLLIKTSDGQEFVPTSTNMEIVWDASKDLTRENGSKYRWIKTYNSNASRNISLQSGMPDSTTNNDGSILFLLIDNQYVTNFKNTRQYYDSIEYTPIEALVFGYKSTTYGGTNTIYNQYTSLRYIKAYNRMTALKLSTWAPIQKLDLYFAETVSSISPSLLQYNYYIKNCDILKYTKNLETSSLFAGPNIVRTVDLTTIKSLTGGGGTNSYVLNSNVQLDTIDLSNLISITRFTEFFSTTNSYIKNIILNENLDLSDVNVTLPNGCIFVKMPNTIKVKSKLDIGGSLKINNVKEIMASLYDYSNESSRTLIMGVKLYDALTNEEKNSVINKNWTISIDYQTH